MGWLDKQRQSREESRRDMELAINRPLDKAVAAAKIGNIEADERAIHEASNAAARFNGFLATGTTYFNARLQSMLGKQLRKSEYLGFAGDVHMWKDRVVLYDQGFEVHRMDGRVRASVETAGELMVSKRPTLTRMAVGAVLPGTALIPGLAFRKQTINDTRALFFVLEHPEWGRLVQLAPEYEGVMRQVAITVNQTAQQLAHVEEQRTAAGAESEGALDALQKLGELHKLGVVTDSEFEEKKRVLLSRL